ncbi:MAG: hypothetical protein LBG80_18185 [Bacteroidales bacterium]|jgi:hypothetical protein|nr:hypothetical protein [Bacteroidales bacterium]
MNLNKYLVFSAIIICIISCQTKTNYIKRVVQEWQGKEIIIPENVKYKILGQDTVCDDMWNKSFKVLTYIDSVECISCRLNLSQWKQFIDTCIAYQPSISFIFIVCSSDYEFFERALISSEFNYPIIYDKKNDFDKLNHFPPIPYRTFLLDADNRVKFIGSPINNPKIWTLYKKIFTLIN